jgi:hypothetical protein
MMKVVSSGSFGKWARRNLVEPLFYSDERVVWRNREASYDVQELEPSSRDKDTYVLQEYFIPVQNIKSFIPKMKSVFDKYDVNVINVSLRHAYADKETYLSGLQKKFLHLLSTTNRVRIKTLARLSGNGRLK